MATSAEYGLGDYAFPRGWFVVADSAEIGRAPCNVRYFGQDLVLYRGESGRVVMLDAYCPHMGTHIGMSKTSATVESDRFMEGDNIRCPFHGWRFGPDGKCNHIPYFDGPIPAGARIRSWQVEERYGLIFAWHDPEKQAPDYPLPEIAQWDDPAWVRWTRLDHLGDLQHPIEIVDNTSDVAHLEQLHGSGVCKYENEVEGHILHQRQSAGTAFADAATFTTICQYYGPAMLLSDYVEAGAFQIIAHTPIDDGKARLWQVIMMRSRTGTVDDQARAERDALSTTVIGGLMRDAEVWANKRPAISVMQLPSDGPFRQSRVWYSQFYNARVKVPGILKPVTGKHYAMGMPPFVQRAAG